MQFRIERNIKVAKSSSLKMENVRTKIASVAAVNLSSASWFILVALYAKENAKGSMGSQAPPYWFLPAGSLPWAVFAGRKIQLWTQGLTVLLQRPRNL